MSPKNKTDATRQKLEKLGIRTDFDKILHLPIRYEDHSRLYSIKDAPLGFPVLVEGQIAESKVQYHGKRRALVCLVEDAGSCMVVRYLNFYPSMIKTLEAGKRMRFFGEIRNGFHGIEMVHPKTEKAGIPLSECLSPIYPTTAGLGQDRLSKIIAQSVASCDLSDTLPEKILSRLDLPGFEESIRFLHFPPPYARQKDLEEKTHPAWRRIKFDELLAQQLSLRLHYRKRKAKNAPPFSKKGNLRQALLSALPFDLTGAQKKVLAEIDADLAQNNPMQRLLQGDVGSGKTIVAALAALSAIENGCQVAVMAPTEILAEQHHKKFSQWLAPLGINIAWISGSQKTQARSEALQSVLEGKAQLAIGTHALFQEKVTFQNMGLLIIDEQHRFGVHQRLALKLKGGKIEPHQLMMSATPIPRTLAMSFYADLDVSVIDELPPGRTPVLTKLLSNERRSEVISRVREVCLQGSQAYWVCPLIEESEALQLQTAVDTYRGLTEEFPDLKTGLIHGRLAAAEKAEVMQSFEKGKIQLLVCTTVIEVGVDVPNASLMVIEHAERMGLSQLHQLRGRVGRGAKKSFCILLYQNPLGKIARQRLKVIFESADGFEIARRDLLLRGPGEFLGARQSGVPMLRFADIEKDVDILEDARQAAQEILETEAAMRHLDRWTGQRADFLRV